MQNIKPYFLKCKYSNNRNRTAEAEENCFEASQQNYSNAVHINKIAFYQYFYKKTPMAN
jgi:hypothetical protein